MSDLIDNNNIDSGENISSEMEKTGTSTHKKEDTESKIVKYLGPIIFITIVVAFVVLAVLQINFGQWIANIAMWFYNTYGWWGIYIGVFVISIFGNFTVIFPVPYVVAIAVISIITEPNPYALAFAAALGAAIGEISAWLVGRSADEYIGENESMIRMQGYVDRGWAPFLVFLFAATPLPDDAFLMVLGLSKYSIKKTLFWCLLGKFVLCFVMSYVPLVMADTPAGIFLLDLFGIDIEAARLGIVPEYANPQLEIIKSTITWIVTLVVIFLMVYVDWGKFFSKFKKKKALKERENSTHPDDVLQ